MGINKVFCLSHSFAIQHLETRTETESKAFNGWKLSVSVLEVWCQGFIPIPNQKSFFNSFDDLRSTGQCFACIRTRGLELLDFMAVDDWGLFCLCSGEPLFL